MSQHQQTAATNQIQRLNHEAETLSTILKERAKYYSADQLRLMRKRKKRILYVLRKIKNKIS